MRGSSSRATELDPSQVISYIENMISNNDNNLQNEVFIRRFISALYYAIFNY